MRYIYSNYIEVEYSIKTEEQMNPVVIWHLTNMREYFYNQQLKQDDPFPLKHL